MYVWVGGGSEEKVLTGIEGGGREGGREGTRVIPHF